MFILIFNSPNDNGFQWKLKMKNFQASGCTETKAHQHPVQSICLPDEYERQACNHIVQRFNGGWQLFKTWYAGLG